MMRYLYIYRAGTPETSRVRAHPRNGGAVHEPEFENITAYRVENEALTGLQEQGFKGTVAAARMGGIQAALSAE